MIRSKSSPHVPGRHSCLRPNGYNRFRPWAEILEERWNPATTYTVNSLLDTNAGSGTSGTLRYVLDQINTTATSSPGDADIVNFSVAGTIAVTGSDLTINANVSVSINGSSAPGYMGVPLVILDGSGAGGSANGLTILGQGSTIQGLQIVNFGGDGILVDGLSAISNTVLQNYIGTNGTSTTDGNGGNGIRITNGARLNTIGGVTPNNPAFTGKPVDGNVISGNGANGVLIENGSSYNTLAGNYIGTDLAGTSAVPNVLDGVAILGSDNNAILGTTLTQQPFVFQNVLSGNGGNGLSVMDSDNTIIHANSFGLGGDNATAVPNQLNGVVIGGNSANTQFGGVIPLGNIVAGNVQNGVVIQDTASGTVCFNTFCGLPSFTIVAVPNGGDGFLISSTGGNNQLRTNVISGNIGNGVHITGAATGVQITETIIGMDTTGKVPLPNGGNGILMDGTANNNTIGGLQPSVILQNTISGNGLNGIAVLGNAANNQIFHSFIGTEILGTSAYGNGQNGILIGENATGTTIGGTQQIADFNLISGNTLNGILITDNATGTVVIGNLIGTDRTGIVGIPNLGNGVAITTSANSIGGTGAREGNTIAFNAGNGVSVSGGTGNAIISNSIFANTADGIALLNGGNQNLAAPVVTNAVQPRSGTIAVTGTITAAANTAYRIEIFASPNAFTPGQGQTFLGFVDVTTDASGFALFQFSGTRPADSGVFISATATDPTDNTSPFSNPTILSRGSVVAVGAGAGGGSAVVILNSDGTQRVSFNTFTGSDSGVRTAVADVTGDGVGDYIVGTGPGVTNTVRIYDGVTLTLIASFQPFESTFTGGVYVAGGDINSDGYADLVVTPDQGGGPVVAVFDGKALAGGTATTLAQYFGIQDPNFRGGARVAVGDVNGDGTPDIVVSAGFLGGPRITIWDGKQVLAGDTGANATPLANFFAFEETLRNGCFVAVGDVNGDGFADLIFGGGPGGGPRVRIADGLALLQAGNFGSLDAPGAASLTIGNFISGDPNSRGGIRVAAANLDEDGFADVVTGGGDNQPATVIAYPGATVLGTTTPPILFSESVFDTTNGVFVG